MEKIPKELKNQDKLLFKLGKKVEILNNLTWPLSTKKKFLKQWKKNNPSLPEIIYPKYNFSEQKSQLKTIAKNSNLDHPLSHLVKETAKSYVSALEMVEAVGTKRFFKISGNIYGTPKDPLNKDGVSTIRAAKRFLKSVKKFDLDSISPPESACILPETVVDSISKAADYTFGNHNIKILTDGKIKSKASASPTKIRVRKGTCFTEHDIQQLIQHELLVHSLTILNGRKQPLKTLGLNSPRSTCAQEGLAVFAEFITNAIDVTRLRRISARVEAIQIAIDGADFIDVFKFFLENGQSEEESFFSAARVFRGGNVRGESVFTKDLVYLKGFIEVHRFFLTALKHKKFLHPQHFISGRMCCEDVDLLAPFFTSNQLSPPAYQPDWISNRSTLLAFLLSSSVMNNLGLSKVDSLG